MSLYNLMTGEPIQLEHGKHILIGAVLDAGTAENRFKAMKQLLDIGAKKLRNPDAGIASNEFTYASKGAVMLLPEQPAMYQRKTLDLLYSKTATTQDIPASVTKVMSLITGMDYIGSVMERITYKSSDEQSGSGDVFDAGDIITVQDLMLAMMLPSSNGSAMCFARICGEKMLQAAGVTSYTDADCRAEFVQAMNRKAAFIGMSNSSFDSPSGLSENNTTTATDLLRMVIEACSYPEICKVWGKQSYTVAVGGTNPRNVTLTSTVTDSAIEAAYVILGGKTGSLNSGAKALVMVAEVEV